MYSLPASTPTSGILTLRQLEALGYDQVARRVAIDNRELERVRNGWFAVPGTPVGLVRAVRLGGKLTCTSALRMIGLWTMPDDLLHVSVKVNAARLRSPDDRRAKWVAADHPDVRLHWNELPVSSRRESPIDDLLPALAHHIACADREGALVAIDSALNLVRGGEPLLRLDALALLLATSPARCRGYLDDADGRSQAGTETLVRLRLKSKGIRVRIQVRIRGVGRVDLLVGDRLVVEVDSRAHHLGDNYEADRRRDLELARQGFVVIRLSYAAVMFRWSDAEAAILDLVHRGEHLLTGRLTRRGLAVVLD